MELRRKDRSQTYHGKPHHPPTTKVVSYEEIEATSAERAEAVAADEDAGIGIVLDYMPRFSS
jgi:hypothetical protein